MLNDSGSRNQRDKHEVMLVSYYYGTFLKKTTECTCVYMTAKKVNQYSLSNSNKVDHSIELDEVGSTLEVYKFHPSFKS